ncbi:ribose 5-phosphate isomerase B [Desulfovermiculus halophilus]|jgi:ribose 5-phosphate isomerase B|uniref:ribose 5-phosphate isomerase B n=1 Tax=Desulfovermiculus halophilus TaxID=339722 RepID=UPI0004858B53|nr:ribose 5-phosphate isomerase B [Desulfovermiculus halophilus]
MNITTMYCGSDHAGLGLKHLCIRHLHNQGWTCTDLGTTSEASCDYPVFAAEVCRTVQTKGQLGLLICGTGLGMSMTANRFSSIRAALCTNEYMARMARMHNNANILCLGARVVGDDVALAILDVFVRTGFEQGRHQKRVELIDSVAGQG